MPRKARLDAPGALQHIIIRGIERQRIFRDDADRIAFVTRLGRVVNESGTICHAWALMPNHAHFLVQTGRVPLSKVMCRSLTGYVTHFNRRYRRHGPLLQNRYKSILCEQEPYLLELVRYIHLNPLRGGLVHDLDELDRYPFSGHSALMGKQANDWQAVKFVLAQFGEREAMARHAYRVFVGEGIALGKRPELVGGGLIRSLGGWAAVKALRESPLRVKGDERILGESAFVLHALASAEERLVQTEHFARRGIDLDRIAAQAAAIFGVDTESIGKREKRPKVTSARSLFCYWAVRELGCSATAIARRLNLTQPAVTLAARRGESIALERGLRLVAE
jgi:REP element-mobilizing transposase RayT